MARTFRRKNYLQERTYKIEGSRLIGDYATYDYYYVDENGFHHHTPIFREMTKEERKKEFLYRHGDHSNWKTPSRHFRKTYQRMVNTKHKKEIQKWINTCGEYEPTFMPHQHPGCLRDWT